jgi:peroxiredoxin
MNRYVRVGATLLILSLFMNVVLAQALRAERKESNRLRVGLLRIKAASGLNVGTAVPPLVGEDASGTILRVTYETGLPTLLYIFSPTCGWCERNINNVKALGQQLSRSHRVLGVTISPVPLESRLKESRSLGFPVLFEISPETVEAYKLGGTPQTLLISSQGVVLENWKGAYTSGLKRRLEAHFGVSLPGLRPM